MDITRAIPALALLLGAAGCQHAADRPRISDSRTPLEIAYQPERAEGDAERIQALPDPPGFGKSKSAGKSALLYFSIPLNPVNFVQFNHTSLNLGGPDFDLSWTGPFDPEPIPLSGPSVRVVKTEEGKLVDVHPRETYIAPVRASHGAPNTDYAQALRQQIYGLESVESVTSVPKSKSPARVLTDDD